MNMTKAEAAQVLGAKESEVRRVRGDVRDTYLVTTTDGTTVRIAPDGDVMKVTAIVDPAKGYQGPLPIERTPPAVEDDEDDEGDEVATVLRGTVEDVVEWVRGGPEGTEPTEAWAVRAKLALDGESAAARPRKSLVAALTEALEGVSS